MASATSPNNEKIIFVALDITGMGKVNEHYFSENPKAKRQKAMIITMINGRPYAFETDSSTFSRHEIDRGTRLLIESMRIGPNDDVLDLGCGYGPAGIAAATAAANGKIYLSDINQRAVELARGNIRRNGIKNAEVRHGSMFEPFNGMRFDVIITNPPIRAGREVIESFIKGSHSHLKKNGSLYIVVRTKQGAKTLKRFMHEIFSNAEYAAMRGGYRVMLAKRLD